jgi:hypothetical protein
VVICFVFSFWKNCFLSKSILGIFSAAPRIRRFSHRLFATDTVDARGGLPMRWPFPGWFSGGLGLTTAAFPSDVPRMPRAKRIWRGGK